jgi:hypothetical protein
MEALRSWPESDRLEIFQLQDNEAAIVLLLAGELGAMPVHEDGEAEEAAATRPEDRSAS